MSRSSDDGVAKWGCDVADDLRFRLCTRDIQEMEVVGVGRRPSGCERGDPMETGRGELRVCAQCPVTVEDNTSHWVTEKILLDGRP